MKIQEIGQLFKAAFVAWQKDKAPTLGAALAYFAVFSLAPLVIIAIAVAGLVFGEEAARGQISAEISRLVGEQAGQGIEAMVQSASKPGSGPVAAAIGIVTLLLGASGVFGQLQETMNLIWEVEPKKTGWMQTVRLRFLSVAMVFGSCFLLLVSLMVSAALSGLVGALSGSQSVAPVLQIVDVLLSVIVIWVLFAALFKFLPDTVVEWRDVWFGAFITSVLFVIGKTLIGLYLGRSGVASTYGAAGSVVLILLWTYYASQILFFGAEITKAYADRHGSRVGSTAP